MMGQMKIRVQSIVKLVGELLKESLLLTKSSGNNLSTSLVVWQHDTNKDTQLTPLLSTFIKRLKYWIVNIWDMAPKQKEQESDDGRNAEDKSQHKGDWGSHSHADKVAEDMEPTAEQLANAQAIINSRWVEEE